MFVYTNLAFNTSQFLLIFSTCIRISEWKSESGRRCNNISYPAFVRIELRYSTCIFIWCNCFIDGEGKEMSNVYDRAFMVKIILSQLVFTCSEQWRRTNVFILNFEQIWHIVLVFPLVALDEVTPTGIAIYQSLFKKIYRNKIPRQNRNVQIIMSKICPCFTWTETSMIHFSKSLSWFAPIIGFCTSFITIL